MGRTHGIKEETIMAHIIAVIIGLFVLLFSD